VGIEPQKDPAGWAFIVTDHFPFNLVRTRAVEHVRSSTDRNALQIMHQFRWHN
jgi:hypothetical protein